MIAILTVISIVWILCLLYIKDNDIDISLNKIDKDDPYVLGFFLFIVLIGTVLVLFQYSSFLSVW